ncbi:MAG: hypothetical protein WC866_00380 [Patescibacteria group bacterium]|jgi:hypothetical protein
MDTSSSPVTIIRPRSSCLTDLAQQMSWLIAGNPDGTPVIVERLMREGGITFGDPDFPTTEKVYTGLVRNFWFSEACDQFEWIQQEVRAGEYCEADQSALDRLEKILTDNVISHAELRSTPEEFSRLRAALRPATNPT